MRLEWPNEAVKDIVSITGKPDRVTAVEIDVRDIESTTLATASIEKSYGRLDVLINNAGIASVDPDIQTRISTSVSVNVTGPASVSHTARFVNCFVSTDETPVHTYLENPPAAAVTVHWWKQYILLSTS